MQKMMEIPGHSTNRSTSSLKSAPAHASGPYVWAIAGGKGGVGKSVISSSIAISMARNGDRTVIVDADLGCANLHTILGVPRPERTLAQFLNNEYAELTEVMCPGPVPNLYLIGGAQAPYEMANPKHSRMRKLLRHIRRLPFDHVLLDLGAGSAFNVLDFFLSAHRGILVVVPEPTSIENAYDFIRAVFFRGLRKAAKDPQVRAAVDHAQSQQVGDSMDSPRHLMDAIRKIDDFAATRIQEQAKAFSPMIVVNQAGTLEHRLMGRDIVTACREYLGTELEFVGALERDECVRVAVSKSKPVVELFPGCDFARDLRVVVDRLSKDRVIDSRNHDERDTLIHTGHVTHDRERLAVRGLALDEAGCEEKIGIPYTATETQAECAVEVLRRIPEPEESQIPLPPIDLDAPGATLRIWREHLGLTFEELVRDTRIRCLQSIESESFDSVPPEPYIRGFVTDYARVLGLTNPAAIAAAFVCRYRLAAAGARPPEGAPSRGTKPPLLGARVHRRSYESAR